MEWKPRLIDPSELRGVASLLSTAFGDQPRVRDEQFAQLEPVAEPDRTFVVDDGDVLAGTGVTYSFTMAVPGGSLPTGGVSWVGVLPTHRRRGILSAVMDALLDQAIERGEQLLSLTASEGTIYRRFGYGVATRGQTLVVDTTRSQPIVEQSAEGRFRLIDEEEAKTVLPAVWERHWRRSPGEFDRTAGWWPSLAVDPEDDRDDASARFLVAHEDTDGTADGFAVYRFLHGGAPGGDYYELRVESVAAADDQVEAALLRFLLDVDLVRQLRWFHAPVDAPLLWQFADARAVKVAGGHDHSWLRVVDVATCLGGRTYATDGAAVIEALDARRPELGGRFQLEGGSEGAACSRTSASPDVTVAMPDLGSLYLGGVTWRTLQLAGLVAEHVPGAVERLDTFFRPPRAPYCATDF